MITVAENLNRRIKESREQVESEFREHTAKISEIATRFQAPVIAINTHKMADRLAAERFEIMVAGRFKTGKSTFLNALLASAGKAAGLDAENGLLPVDTLPCTAVLTRVSYAKEPFVRAKLFEGRTESWSFERYLEEARIYGELDPNSKEAENSVLTRVSNFEIGLPIELLSRGVVLVDSPGVSEDARRTALAREALGQVHSAIIMLRSDMLAGQDEIDFALEAIEQTGRAFIVVNMFPPSVADPRFRRTLETRTSRLRSEADQSKLEAQPYLIDCHSAFVGYTEDLGDKVRASGILELENRIADFLVNEAYSAKVYGAVDGTLHQIKALEVELGRQRVASEGESSELQLTLDECDQKMAEIDARRERIAPIFGRIIQMAQSEAADSYRALCAELAKTIDKEFAKRPIPALETTLGKMAAPLSKKAAKQASAILYEIIEERVQNWGNAPVDEPGLQHDIADVIEQGRQELDAQFADIERRMQAIDMAIGKLDRSGDEPEAPVGLRDRLLSGAAGYLVFGPLGVAASMGGWRSLIGGSLGLMGSGVALTILTGTLGLALGPLAIVGLILASFVGGMMGGAAFDIDARIRNAAMEAVRPKLLEMATNQKAISAIKTKVGETLRAEADATLAALDEVLAQQRESLAAMRSASRASIEERKATLAQIAEANSVLNKTKEALRAMRKRAAREDAHANPEQASNA